MARKSVLNDHLDLIGVITDREVAERVGVTPENVRAYRKRRGIPAQWRNEQRGAAAQGSGKRRRRRSKLDPYRELLGKISDQEVADKAGVSLSNVRQYRYRHEIKLERAGSASEPPPLTTRRVDVDGHSTRDAVSYGRWAYKVVADIDGARREWVTFAANMVAAVVDADERISQRHPRAVLREVALIAESL